MSQTQRHVHVEIELTTRCDKSCWGCNRFVDVAPTSAMTLEQIGHFIAESVVLQWPWERIRIMGGEPTLHPQFREVIEKFIAYRDTYNPKAFLRVVTNSEGKLPLYQEWLDEVGIKWRGSPYKGDGADLGWFCNIRNAPIDRFPELQLTKGKPCAIYGYRGCGIGLTKHGMFLCGVGASICRILGLDIGVKRLEDLTREAMLEQARQICHYCGHYALGKVAQEANRVRKTGRVCSLFWQKALETYKTQQPTLGLYGVP